MKNENARSFRQLQVWQFARKFVKRAYEVTRKFPDEERFGLTSQIRRAAVSVPTNVAEGWSRGHRLDFARFVSVALGSTGELETLFTLSGDLEILSLETAASLQEDIERIRAMLLNLRASLRSQAAGA